jgi:cysteinyl-tRNA synthetase
MMYRITPQKITELLELRNKARRELNFAEADRIRNYLRSCGVCLIDEKGRRGRAT